VIAAAIQIPESFQQCIFETGDAPLFPAKDRYCETLMADLTKFTTAPIKDVAHACGFKGSKQFRQIWEAAGYPIIRMSPRKLAVYVADVAKFQNERIVKTTNDQP
jgi:hypothetical protein